MVLWVTVVILHSQGLTVNISDIQGWIDFHIALLFFWERFLASDPKIGLQDRAMAWGDQLCSAHKSERIALPLSVNNNYNDDVNDTIIYAIYASFAEP